MGLILLHLAPLWLFRWFPSQDGPSHVANADVIRRYSDPASSELRRYYVLATDREGNWLGHLMLAGVRYAASPAAATSIALSAYVILFPLAVLYALRSITARAVPWAVLAFPFVFNYPLHMGFFNFAWSIPIFFFLIGWFLRGRRSLSSYVTFAALSLLLYLFHPGTWAMAALAIGVLAGAQAVLEWIAAARARKLDLAGFWRIAMTRLLAPFLALLPALALMLRFTSHAGGAASIHLKIQSPKLLYSAALQNTFSFRNILEHRIVQGLLVAYVAAAAALLFWKIAERSFSRGDALFLVPAVFLTMAFVTPDEMLNGQFLRPRLLLFVCVTLVLWFGSEIRSRTAADVALAAGAAASVALLVVRAPAYAVLDRLIDEYVSAGSVMESNRTMLALDFLPYGPMTRQGVRLVLDIHPFQHTSGYIASSRNVIDLANYEANTDEFPVRFRPGMNPYKRVGDVENNQDRMNRVNLSGYAGTGGSVDYVLLWGARVGPDGGNPMDVAPLLRQLDAGYERVFVSRPLGLAEVYRRKGLGARPPL